MTKLSKSEKDQRIADDLLAGYTVRKIARIRGVGNNRIQEVRESIGADLDMGEQDRADQFDDQNELLTESETDEDEDEDEVRTGLGSRPTFVVRNFGQGPLIAERVEPVRDPQSAIEQMRLERKIRAERRLELAKTEREIAEMEAYNESLREDLRRLRSRNRT